MAELQISASTNPDHPALRYGACPLNHWCTEADSECSGKWSVKWLAGFCVYLYGLDRHRLPIGTCQMHPVAPLIKYFAPIALEIGKTFIGSRMIRNDPGWKFPPFSGEYLPTKGAKGVGWKHTSRYLETGAGNVTMRNPPHLVLSRMI